MAIKKKRKPKSKAIPRKKFTKSKINPHTIKPIAYNYPNQGPTTITYKNARSRKERHLTLWVHPDRVIHWMERDLWHHLTPIQPKSQVIHIGVGSCYIPNLQK